jgi:hypothetical protein
LVAHHLYDAVFSSGTIASDANSAAALQVYSVLLGAVFEPLLVVAYATAGAQQQLAGDTVAAAQQLLCGVLFGQQHLGGLCEIVAGAAGMHLDGLAAAAAAAGTAAATAAAEEPETAAVNPPAKRHKADVQGKQQQQQQQQQQAGVQSPLQAQLSVLLDPAVTALLHKTYQGQLLLRLHQLVGSSLTGCRGFSAATAAAAAGGADGLKSTGKKQRRQQQQQQQTAAGGPSAVQAQQPAAAAAAVLHALPQLLQGCVEAVRRYRRTLEEGEQAQLVLLGG